MKLALTWKALVSSHEQPNKATVYNDLWSGKSAAEECHLTRNRSFTSVRCSPLGKLIQSQESGRRHLEEAANFSITYKTSSPHGSNAPSIEKARIGAHRLKAYGTLYGTPTVIHLGSQQAGPKVAAILSVVESCRRLELPIRHYLAVVLPGLANRPIKHSRRPNPRRIGRTKTEQRPIRRIIILSSIRLFSYAVTHFVSWLKNRSERALESKCRISASRGAPPSLLRGCLLQPPNRPTRYVSYSATYGSGWSNVIRQPSGPLLGSCLGKKWDSRYKGESASSCE